MIHTFCLEILKREFEQRRLRNSSYSLRAFARDLQVSITALSEVMAGKRDLSRKNLGRMIEALHLSPVECEMLLDRKIERTPQELARLHLQDEEFRLIADWYHLAILNLAKIKDNKAKPAWVAQRLGLSMAEATEALARLRKLKLLEVKAGRLVRTAAPISTSRDIPSAAIKKYHKDHLILAERSLMEDPVEVREFSSVVMAMNPEKLSDAKEYLMKAKRKVSEMLQKGESKEVYVLSFQMYPLTKTLNRVKREKKNGGMR